MIPDRDNPSEKRRWTSDNRLQGLRRFAFAITLLTVLGHTWFGFEQSWLQPVVGVLTAYLVELLLETVGAVAEGRRPRYAGGFTALANFLLSAHISGLAVSMLLYANDRFMPIAFAAAVAIASKSLVRVAVNGGSRHVLNPSNFGITATLLCFPWVGIAQPYHFTENLSGAANWVLPAIIICSGTFLNARYTRRLPLLAAWVGVFVLQALVRGLAFDAALGPALLPATGVAFLLFSFYMVTDPATTPSSVRGQVAFGGAVALCYGVLLTLHVVFGLFFALSIVTALRGVLLFIRSRAATTAPVPAPAGPRPATTVSEA